MRNLIWRLYMYKPIWQLCWEVRNRWNSIKWKLALKFVAAVYEIKPDRVYVLILNNPKRGEVEALRDIIKNAPPSINIKGALIWGPNLQIKDLKDFLEEYHLIDKNGKVLFPLDTDG